MKNYLVIFIFILSTILFSCRNNSFIPTPDISNTIATISIMSVSPDTGLVDGEETLFSVEVDYTIEFADQAEICIGFNNWELTSYSMETPYIIDDPSGSYTFNVTVTAKDWGSSGDFAVLAIISDYPHALSWIPLDHDTYSLSF